MNRRLDIPPATVPATGTADAPRPPIRFTGKPIPIPIRWRDAVAALVLGLACGDADAAPPDLTNGGVPGDSITTNLGPTGLRGWVYHVSDNSAESRQIQITAVAAGSPAAGLMEAGDVILGASGTGTDPVNFTADARKSLANAINDAEARDPATLKLIRWRAGVTGTVAIPLQTMGTYSATAPYHWPKSALIPDAATRAQMMSDERDGTSMVTWQRGHTLVALAEYYLATGDTQTLPAIEAYAVNIAKNTSLFGTVGHIVAEKFSDGGPNGPMGGVYGPVNSTGMPCFLGLLLARECGLVNPEIEPAIVRASRFFASYAGKGAIPYGEHEPYPSHENNGKSSLAALCFALQDNRVTEGRFFAKLPPPPHPSAKPATPARFSITCGRRSARPSAARRRPAVRASARRDRTVTPLPL